MSDTLMPIDVLRLIMISGLSTTDDAFDPKRVMIWNNKSVIPKDQELFITLEMDNSKTLANSTKEGTLDDGYSEIQTLTMQEVYNIDIMSRDLSALRRKEEVIMALKSSYSQNKQVENGIMIAKVANLLDISSVEATARLFRFQCAVTLHASYTKETLVDYYDTFSGEVEMEDGENVELDLT